MTPDGWEIRKISNKFFEFIYWEDDERSIEFTLLREEAEELLNNLQGALADD